MREEKSKVAPAIALVLVILEVGLEVAIPLEKAPRRKADLKVGLNIVVAMNEVDARIFCAQSH